MNALIASGERGTRALMLPALLVTGALAVLFYALPAGTPGRAELIGGMLALAPAVALAAGVTAARALSGTVGRPWIIISGAAAFAFAGQVHGYAMPGPQSIPVLLNVAALALLALAFAWILYQRDRERLLELGLDAGLVIAATTVVTLRFSPAAQAIFDAPANYSPAAQIGNLGAPIATGCALLFAAVLLVVRGRSPAGRIAPALAAAAAAFGLAVVPLAMGDGACCTPQHSTGVAYAAGWLFLAYAGVRTAAGGVDEFQPVGVDAGGNRLRLVVAPAVALVMGVVVVHAAWYGPLQDATAAALSVLGLLLALRVSQLLFATQSQTAERLELAQSRALIEVSHALSNTRELDETLHLVAHWARQLLNARAATIELLTEDGEHLEPRAVNGLPDDVLRLKFPVNRSFSGWVVRNGQARTATDAGRDEIVHPTGRQYLMGQPMASAPLRYGDSTFGALTCIGQTPFTPREMELLGAFADQAAVAIENARLFRQVHQLSLTDPLTGLANRRQLERDLAREFAAARRGRRLVAVMFDLNCFKQYNDTYGHLAGDEALRLFGAALATETRAMNMAARYGGDEFIALLADADAAGTAIFIERVRERFPGPAPDSRLACLSVAAGFALYQPDMNHPHELVAAADRALYADKAVSSRASRVRT